MKSLRLITASALLAVGIGSQIRPSYAAYYPQYTTGIQVQNTSSSLANVVLTFHPSPGPVINVPDTISGSSSKTYFPLPGAVPPGFNGAAVISADQPVVAVVNVIGGPNVASSSGTFGRGAYAAALQGSTTLLLPLLLKNHGSFQNTTWFRVQNIGTAPADIFVNYSDSTSNSALNVQPGDSVVFDQSAETHSSTIFAATVTSTQPLAAAVVQEANPGIGHLVYAYSGFSGGSTNPVMPLINKNINNGYVTGVQIQNGGTTSTQVTVTYFPANSSPPQNPSVGSCTETQTIPPGGSANFTLGVFNGTPGPGVSTTCPSSGFLVFIGSAQVTGNSANQPLVVIVNQRQTGTGNGAGAYNGFDPATGKQKVVFPLILDRAGSLQNYTGFNVQNVGTMTTTVTCAFSGNSLIVSQMLGPGAALNAVHQFQLANGYVGAATCTASNPTDKIIGVLNQVAKTGLGDRLFVSEGVSLD